MKCEKCGREFKNAMGLNMHNIRAHSGNVWASVPKKKKRGRPTRLDKDGRIAVKLAPQAAALMNGAVNGHSEKMLANLKAKRDEYKMRLEMLSMVIMDFEAAMEKE